MNRLPPVECFYDAYIGSYEAVAPDMQSLKEAVYQAPISSAMTVHEDSSSYTGGCYEHVGGAVLNHYVVIVGRKTMLRRPGRMDLQE
jgi:hypothetical protein